jgi:hypothetical protein
MAVPISSDFQAEPRALPDSEYFAPSDHQNWVIVSRGQRLLKQLMPLYIWIFHFWMESEERVIIRFLLQKNANAI